MIILLYGEDGYRKQKKKSAIIGEFRKRHPFAPISFLYFESSADLEKLRSFAANQAIFESAKLCIAYNALREISATKETKAFLEKLAEDESITLLLVEEKNIPKAFAFLGGGEHGNHVLTQRLDPPSGSEYREFIMKEASEKGLVLDDGAVRSLAMAHSGDTWALVTDLDKLSLLGKNGIDTATCKSILIKGAEDAFPLIRELAFSAGSAKLSALERLLGQREDAAKIFNMLAYQKKEHTLLFADYDVAVKSGKIDYEEALLDWVALSWA